MKNHVIVLTIDLDAIAKKAMQVMECISLPFLWLYYTIAGLAGDIVFYTPYAWRAVKRYSKDIKRYIHVFIRYLEDFLKTVKRYALKAVDMILYSGMFFLFLIYSLYKKSSSWFVDAWAFRAAILAEC